MKKLHLLPLVFLMLMALVGCGSIDTAASGPEPTAAVIITTTAPSSEPIATPTPMPTVAPTAPAESTTEQAGSFSGWQEAYKSYIENNSHDSNGGNSYCLIYLDDDDIPELLDFGVSEADGTRVVVYNNGSFTENQMSRLSVQYIPGENLLLNNEGNMGYYTANVYSIVNGVLTKIASGTQSEDTSAPELDSDGFLIAFHFKCTWNGESVTEEEYAANLNAAFDSSKAVAPTPPYDKSELGSGCFYSASQMLAALTSGTAIPYSSN
jgi:hypothetical protein